MIEVLNKEQLALARAHVEKCKARDDELRDLLKANQEDQRQHEDAIALYVAKFKPGTRVLYREKAFEIAFVRLRFGDTVEYHGRQLKKDGTPGASVRELYSWQGNNITAIPPQPPRG